MDPKILQSLRWKEEGVNSWGSENSLLWLTEGAPDLAWYHVMSAVIWLEELKLPPTAIHKNYCLCYHFISVSTAQESGMKNSTRCRLDLSNCRLINTFYGICSSCLKEKSDKRKVVVTFLENMSSALWSWQSYTFLFYQPLIISLWRRLNTWW